ncbi:MAG: ankyrin repeat domain-containing protein [Anaerolineales bacterium]|nr:ankyrin repeat domain-containing protein [Anaerolineales bacterium]
MTEPTADQIREFVSAGHWNLPAVQALLAEHPSLLNRAYAWSETDHETAIQAAAHVGHVPIAEFLLAQGAPLAIPTAAMLGRRADVERLLAEDPARSAEAGAHGIPLLAHAAFSGDAGLVALLYERGARAGASMALAHAAQAGHLAVARWLVEHAAPDREWKNWQAKTALTLAEEAGHTALAELLRQPGG